jgi:serine protease Do
MKLSIGKICKSLLLGLTLSTLQIQMAWSMPAEEISRLAKSVTVIIDGSELGSGVTIGREGQQYYILTNWHVLKKLQGGSIVTPDGARHAIVPNSIRQIQGVDLAICAFASSKSYRIAELGNSDNVAEGTTIHITGAPANLNGIQSRTLLVVGGQVVGYDRPAENGYGLIYNNNTMPGMSGGPVIDSNGNLVAIHGRGSRDAQNQKSGFNLGIPINTFKQSAAKLRIKYTASQDRIDRPNITPSTPGTNFRGRPREIDGSDGSNEVCPGKQC